jgi:hypothetical protein
MNTVVRRATEVDSALLSSLNEDVQALHAAALPWRFKPPGRGFPPAEAAALDPAPLDCRVKPGNDKHNTPRISEAQRKRRRSQRAAGRTRSAIAVER